MSERWARALLTTYRLAGAAAYPMIGGYVAWRTAKGKEDRARRHERYGKSPIVRPAGPLVWVHAASVGETLAVVPLVNRIGDLGINVVMTTGTVTSARIVADRLAGTAVHQYVPLDLKPAIDHFLTHWNPDLAIMAESEIWPMTILELGAKRVPQVLVNGRLSDRSFDAWRKRPYIAEALFENLAHVVAQSEIDGERFNQLGARPVTVSGNLKVDTEIPPVDEEALAALTAQIGDRKRWAAISTHAGEEEIAANAHYLAKKQNSDVLTILVPRHPDRAGPIASALKSAGFTVARRSRNEKVTPQTDFLLGDTIGEMGLYLRLTEIAFVGRSITGEGGQNPLEPAVLGTAVLSGRNVQNFRETYQRLVASGGARLVADGETLAGAVTFLLNNDRVRAKMIEAGRETVEAMRGALDRTLEALEPYVQPLVVKAKLESNGRRR